LSIHILTRSSAPETATENLRINCGELINPFHNTEKASDGIFCCINGELVEVKKTTFCFNVATGFDTEEEEEKMPEA